MFDPYALIAFAAGLLLTLAATRAGADTLFPTDLPGAQWAEFPARGFSRPVSGVIYRRSHPATNGVPLGGVDTGCLDLETSGLLGYCTIFNSHVPRRGPLNLPLLGLAAAGSTWVLCDPQPKPYATTDGRDPVEPVPLDLPLQGVATAREIHYWGHYPVADLEFELDGPVEVGLRAWAPFLPGDLEASMIPGIVADVHLRNAGAGAQAVTLALSFPGPSANEAGGPAQRSEVTGPITGTAVSTPRAGYVIAAVGAEDVRRGGALNADGGAWAEIARTLPPADDAGASLAVDLTLGGGEARWVRFVLTWCSPQWKGGGHPAATEGNPFTHMYALRYPDPVETAHLLARDGDALLRRTLAWQEAIYADADLPAWLRDGLVNVLHLITETGMWAAAGPPLPDWVSAEDGLFGMNECPRGCPQIECLPCSFYGNLPVVYFFPRLALSTLRGYKGYQYPEGAAPWIFGGVTGKTPPIDFACPTRGYQTTLNGPCYIAMVDRFWRCHGEGHPDSLREFWPSLRSNTEFTINLRPEYDLGDRVISMPTGNEGTEWFEAPEPGWFGMVPHVGGIHLAHLRIAERMAQAAGDREFAQRCRQWLQAGSHSLETKLWAEGSYLTFWEPETGKRSDLVFAYQLDGEWIARFHGLEGVFRAERVPVVLETIKRVNVPLTPSGAVNYANADGTPAAVGGYGPYSYFPPEVLMLAMTYMYAGEREFGLDLARRCWENIVCKWRCTWDMPNLMRGDAPTGEPVFGHDYYQDLMLWSLPAAMAGEDLAAPLRPGGLAQRVIAAAGGR